MDWMMVYYILSFLLVIILVLAFRKRKQENEKFPIKQFVVSLIVGIGIFVIILSNLL
ncbi:hypothetical protein J27TS8_40150 [Robertmurraya siralis]|uniref:Uncharacterized protein n=1 Tax=Robertmurraya siralis TaxID=77777 RepID=A0A919WLQ2_9BACI|nr:hypothetical protein [Robertmurraya siralis]GIN64022.1 hypothetical protein J27TS8_40150 [Robertmurraya siralis]